MSTPTSADFPHLPEWAKKSVDNYAEKIATGQTVFDPEGYAHYPYPSDPWLTDFLAAKLAEIYR